MSSELEIESVPDSTHIQPADITSKIVGDFGKWQLRLCLMMALLKMPVAWYQLNIIFFAPPQDFWCEKPKEFEKFSDRYWRDICCPVIEEHPCFIFDPNMLVNNLGRDIGKIPLRRCKKFIYDLTTFTRTITSEWDLVCSKHWLTHLAQFTTMGGVLIGSIVFGVLADRRGRKMPLLVSITMQSVFGLVGCFYTNYWLFLVNRFLIAAATGGIIIISFVICMEVVGGKWRIIMPALSQLPFGLGSSVLAGWAYWLRDWRKIEFALACMSSLFLLCFFIVPESPRWLIATGQKEKAIEVLKIGAHVNNKTFDPEILERVDMKKKGTKDIPSFMAFLKSPLLRVQTITLSVNWFCSGLSFYTFSQYLTNISSTGNIFATVAWSGLISSPGAILCAILILICNRKTTVAVFQLLTAVCFLFLWLLPDSLADWPRIVIAGIGLAGMSGSVPALYLISAEIYPTIGRNVAVSGVTTFARVGSMMAPLLTNLDDLKANLTLILLTFMSFGQLLLLTLMPETKGRELPDTIEEAEQRQGISMKTLKDSKDDIDTTQSIALQTNDSDLSKKVSGERKRKEADIIDKTQSVSSSKKNRGALRKKKNIKSNSNSNDKTELIGSTTDE